jgi:hypothetical protein
MRPVPDFVSVEDPAKVSETSKPMPPSPRVMGLPGPSTSTGKDTFTVLKFTESTGANTTVCDAVPAAGIASGAANEKVPSTDPEPPVNTET